MAPADCVVRPLESVEELNHFLAPRRASSMFLLGNASQVGLEDHNQRLQGSYLGAYQKRGAQEELVGVLAHYWNHNIILQAPAGLESLLAALPHYAQRFQRPLGGILGPDLQVLQALDYFQLGPEQLSLNSREALFELQLEHLRLQPLPPNSQIRHFRPDELELLTRWKVGYTCEALQQDDSEKVWRESRELAEIQIAEQAYWLLDVAGTPVSCSLFNTRCPGMVQIGGVWTPPEQRGQAYARCVVAASLEQARREGEQQAILFTGEDNLPAIRAYTALGFEQVGHYRLSLLRTPRPL